MPWTRPNWFDGKKGNLRLTFLIKFLSISAIAGLLLIVPILLLFRAETKHRLEKIQVHERVHLDVYQILIKTQLSRIASDLQWLSQQNELHQWLESGDRRWLQGVASEYLALSSSRAIYDQIRFLDQEGLEVVRVNYRGGRPEIVAEAALQDKGGRYYFEDTWRLGPGQIFVSPLDLNIEQGQIEKPFKPMLRFGMPVLDAAGQKRGIVLLNYLAGDLLKALQEASGSAEGDFMLLNSEGYWLASVDPDDAWGFMLAERQERNFARLFPSVWDMMCGSESGQMENSLGLFSFVSIRPFAGADNPRPGARKSVEFSEAVFPESDCFWVVVSHVPAQVLRASRQGLRYGFFWICSLTAFLILGVSYLLAQSSVRREAAQEELFRLAMVDTLTGIGNRKAFQDRLEYCFEQAYRYQTPLELLMIDLDGFKSVNDSYGHYTGDLLLQEVARRLLRCVRQADTLARMGGDEFAVILTHVEPEQGSDKVARRILDSLQTPFFLSNRNITISASIGASLFPGNAKNPDELLQQADKAMYEAKAAGKNCFRHF